MGLIEAIELLVDIRGDRMNWKRLFFSSLLSFALSILMLCCGGICMSGMEGLTGSEPGFIIFMVIYCVLQMVGIWGTLISGIALAVKWIKNNT